MFRVPLLNLSVTCMEGPTQWLAKTPPSFAHQCVVSYPCWAKISLLRPSQLCSPAQNIFSALLSNQIYAVHTHKRDRGLRGLITKDTPQRWLNSTQSRTVTLIMLCSVFLILYSVVIRWDHCQSLEDQISDPSKLRLARTPLNTLAGWLQSTSVINNIASTSKRNRKIAVWMSLRFLTISVSSVHHN